MMAAWQEFLQASFIWKDALIAAALVAACCGWLGVYISLKRVLFISATLPQVSGLGIALAFFIGSFFGPHGHEASLLLQPTILSFFFTILVTSLFSLNISHRRMSAETSVGIGYVVAMAFVVLILASPRIVQEAHEIGDVLFGNAVVVSPELVIAMTATAIFVLALHGAFFKEFVSITFDPEMSATLGVKVRSINFLLYLTFAVTITVATRVLGALPVFGFMVIPPAAALMLTDQLKSTIALSMVIAVFSAIFGYFLSFVLSVPTGAAMVAVSASFLIPGLARIALFKD